MSKAMGSSAIPGPTRLRARAAGFHRTLLVLAAGVGALVLGAVIAVAPVLAVGVMAAGAILILAFVAPVAHLTILLLLTLIVPFGILNTYSFGGSGSAGLIASDVLLLTGLLRAAVVLPRMPLTPRQLVSAAIITVLLAAFTVQGIRGVLSGAVLSETGFELRSLLGWGTLLIAMPIVASATGRARLLRNFVVVGLLLGAWGLFQYFVGLPVDPAGHYGVRDSVAFTDQGRSVQGGLFGFPAAFLLALAALTAAADLSTRTRTLLVAVAALNGVSLLLTYERSFWLATIVGFAFVAAKGTPRQRLQTLVVGVVICVLAVPLLVSAAPGALSAAQQRLLSLRHYGSDNSLRARIVESREATEKIADRPLEGWGLGDDVRWGMPWLRTPPANFTFLHNGYLWMAWKLGIPVIVVLVALMAWAMFARGPTNVRPVFATVRHGAQGTLLAMLMVAVAFPSFRVLVITPTLGVMLALCLVSREARDDP